VAWLPHHLFPPDNAIRINMPVLLFSAGLAILTAVLFGLFPALQMAKPEQSLNQVPIVGNFYGGRPMRRGSAYGVLPL
jgi:hypothetical protein